MARSKQSNRILVFLRCSQSVGTPPSVAQHRCSKSFALRMVYSSFARWLDKAMTMIQLTTDEAWAMTKERFRLSDKVPAPQLLPPLAWYSFATYPPKPYETNGAQRQSELWLRAERF